MKREHLVPDQTDGKLVAIHLVDLEALVAKAGQRWLSVANAARYADLSEESVRRLLSAGKLVAYRPRRGKLLIDRQQLDTYILATADSRRRSRRT